MGDEKACLAMDRDQVWRRRYTVWLRNSGVYELWNVGHKPEDGVLVFASTNFYTANTWWRNKLDAQQAKGVATMGNDDETVEEITVSGDKLIAAAKELAADHEVMTAYIIIVIDGDGEPQWVSEGASTLESVGALEMVKAQVMAQDAAVDATFNGDNEH